MKKPAPKPWTTHEDQTLIEHANARTPHHKIVEIMPWRTRNAITQRIYDLRRGKIRNTAGPGKQWIKKAEKINPAFSWALKIKERKNAHRKIKPLVELVHSY